MGTSLPIKIGNQIGNFKEEYCGILHFSSLGSKTSCVLYLEDSDIQSSVKVKGLNLKGKQAANIINPETYIQQVKVLSLILKFLKLGNILGSPPVLLKWH